MTDLIKRKLILCRIKPDSKKISEILILCQELTNNKYLFKDVDCTNINEVSDFVLKVLENPEIYTYTKNNNIKRVKKPLKERLKEIFSNAFSKKIIIDETKHKDLENLIENEEPIENDQFDLDEDIEEELDEPDEPEETEDQLIDDVEKDPFDETIDQKNEIGDNDGESLYSLSELSDDDNNSEFSE